MKKREEKEQRGQEGRFKLLEKAAMLQEGKRKVWEEDGNLQKKKGQMKDITERSISCPGGEDLLKKRGIEMSLGRRASLYERGKRPEPKKRKGPLHLKAPILLPEEGGQPLWPLTFPHGGQKVE